MGGGSWLLLALFLGFTVFMIGVATGKVSIGVVRDERDSLYSRWFFGGLSVVGGVAIALAAGRWLGSLIGVGLAVSGAAVVWTARRRAPTDPTNRVPDDVVRNAAREFVFDSRPPPRASIEAYAAPGWTAFLAVSSLVFSAVLVGIAIVWLPSDPDQLPGRLALVATASGFFLVILIGPSIWWTQRAVRGIPMLTIDSFGIVLGRDRSTDLSMAWDDVDSVEVRMLPGDRLLIVYPRRPDWISEQPSRWRVYARVSRWLYGGYLGISTMALTVPLVELLARIAAHRPSLLAADAPGTTPGATSESPSR